MVFAHSIEGTKTIQVMRTGWLPTQPKSAPQKEKRMAKDYRHHDRELTVDYHDGLIEVSRNDITAYIGVNGNEDEGIRLASPYTSRCTWDTSYGDGLVQHYTFFKTFSTPAEALNWTAAKVLEAHDLRMVAASQTTRSQQALLRLYETLGDS